MTPLIVTLTGPCCSGKSTLERALAARGFQPAISTTTRKPRDGEVDGVAYHFVDESQFKKIHHEQGFIECIEFNGNSYGLSKAEIARITALGKPVTVVCEPHGQARITAFAMAQGWGVVRVFVDAPVATLARRYMERFKSDIEAGAGQGVVETYGKRLTTLIQDELWWSCKTNSYDVYVAEYCIKTQSETIERIIADCSVT